MPGNVLRKTGTRQQGTTAELGTPEVGEESTDTFAAAAAAPCSSDVLAEEAVDMLTPEEKDEIILQMHAQLGHMNGRVEEVIALSERTVYSLERAHGEALGEQRASDKRLRQELSQWKHCHPEVSDLREENARLREEAHSSRRQYLAALGKLARREELLKTRR